MYIKDEIIKVPIEKVDDLFIVVTLKQGQKGIVYKKELSDYFGTDVKKLFIVGNNITLKILGTKTVEGFLELTFKKITPSFLKNPFEYKIKETESGYSNLQKEMSDFLKKEK